MRASARRVLIVGLEGYGERLSRLLNEYSQTWRSRYYSASRIDSLLAVFASLRADAIVCVGGPAPNAALVEIARRRNMPIVVIWVGSDIPAARDEPHLLEIIKRYGLTNICESDSFLDELASLGISATHLSVTPLETASEPVTLPTVFRVLSLARETPGPQFADESVYAVARALPHISFTSVGHNEPNPDAPENVHFPDAASDIARQIDDAVAIVQLCEPTSKLALEGLARGRHVVWSRDLPGTIMALDVEQTVAAIASLYESHRSGALAPNHAGLEYVRERFSRARCADNFERALELAQPPATSDTPQRPRKVAISGLHLFAAQIAEHVEERPPRWEPRIIRTRDRIEVVTAIFTLAACDVWYSIGAPIGDRWVYLFAKILRKPRVIHWVGSDIQTLYSNRNLRKVCAARNVTNLAEVDWTIEELAQVGIKASLAPLPPHFNATRLVWPLPDRFTIMLYLPKTRGDFYGRREYERLFRTFAGRPIRFLVVGGGDCVSPPEADVVRLGWCRDLNEAYAQSTVLLRLTQHDGLSIMVLEALTCGRRVLWTQDFPFVTRVRNYEDCEHEIEELLKAHLEGTLRPASDIAKVVSERYSPARCIANIERAWDDALVPPQPASMAAKVPS